MIASGIRAVLFDLDGTLVASAADIVFSVNAALERLGLRTRDPLWIQRQIGDGTERLMQRVLAGKDTGAGADVDPALMQAVLETFREIYGAHLCRETRLYPGAEALLAELAARGLALGCVTNKPARFTEPLLEMLGVAHRFAVVVSGDTLPRRKPDPEPLLHAAAALSMPPPAVVMVGDSQNDIDAARAAGMPVVCVTYGYNAGADIRGAGADGFVDTLADLPALMPARA